MMIQALVTLKQKVRKYNKEFETEIQSFRENPVNSEDERAELGMKTVLVGTSDTLRTDKVSRLVRRPDFWS